MKDKIYYSVFIFTFGILCLLIGATFQKTLNTDLVASLKLNSPLVDTISGLKTVTIYQKRDACEAKGGEYLYIKNQMCGNNIDNCYIEKCKTPEKEILNY